MKHSQLLFTAYDVNFADNGVQFPWLGDVVLKWALVNPAVVQREWN